MPHPLLSDANTSGQEELNADRRGNERKYGAPTRQWVLSFPWPLRFLYASRPDILSRTLGVITRAIETDLIHRAGFTRESGARSGIITLVQRFGSALNLNIHLHMIVLDGVYTFDDDAARFHSIKAPKLFWAASFDAR